MSGAEYWGIWGRLVNPITPTPTAGRPCHSHFCGFVEKPDGVCPCGDYPASSIRKRRLSLEAKP